jgi:hypothetical protein
MTDTAAAAAGTATARVTSNHLMASAPDEASENPTSAVGDSMAAIRLAPRPITTLPMTSARACCARTSCVTQLVSPNPRGKAAIAAAESPAATSTGSPVPTSGTADSGTVAARATEAITSDALVPGRW